MEMVVQSPDDLTGSIHRECLDYIAVLNETCLRRTLRSYFACYLRARTRLALAKDAPEPRVIQPPELGGVVEIPEAGRTPSPGRTTRGAMKHSLQTMLGLHPCALKPRCSTIEPCAEFRRGRLWRCRYSAMTRVRQAGCRT